MGEIRDIIIFQEELIWQGEDVDIVIGDHNMEKALSLERIIIWEKSMETERKVKTSK